MPLPQLSDANKATAEFAAEINDLERSSKSLDDDALAALGNLDLAGPQLDSFLQGQKEFEEAHESFKKALDHGQTIQKRCDHFKNGLVSKREEVMRMPRRIIPPTELVDECMSIILMAFGSLDEFRFDEKSKRIFFNHELEEEREKYGNLLKLHKGANGIILGKDRVITSRDESLFKMKIEKDDMKAKVTARDQTIVRIQGTINARNKTIKDKQDIIDKQEQTIIINQGTIVARDQTISELRAEILALQGARKEMDNLEAMDDVEVIIRLGRGERVFSWS